MERRSCGDGVEGPRVNAWGAAPLPAITDFDIPDFDAVGPAATGGYRPAAAWPRRQCPEWDGRHRHHELGRCVGSDICVLRVAAASGMAVMVPSCCGYRSVYLWC